MPINQPTISQEDNNIHAQESFATPTLIQNQEELSPESTPRQVKSLTDI